MLAKRGTGTALRRARAPSCAALSGLLVAAAGAAAQDLSKVPPAIWKPDLTKVEIKATKVAGNVWMLEGAGGFSGGNIAASIGEDGVAIVDDKFGELSPRIPRWPGSRPSRSDS